VELNDLLAKSDVVFLCVPGDEVGHGFFGAEHIANMKEHSLLVSFLDSHVFDVDALYTALDTGKIRVISDHPMDVRFAKFSKSTFYSFKASNAFNTKAALKFTSDQATKAMINLLTTGRDEHRVN
jgi:lactate dehydrogenase-like 2-hydroxyacid dehydrogenase